MREVIAIAMVSPLGPKVSIIIPAHNESPTMTGVIGQASLVRPGSEIIVVCNGSTDRTASRAKKAGATKVIISQASLGRDVSRSVGAKHASGDILLFLNADHVVPSELLIEYVRKVEEGWDVVLNQYSGVNQKHRVNVSKYLLNHFLRRPDLEGASLATAPHAISRHALNVIGIEQLSVPPIAHALAILNGLTVTSCGYIAMPEVHDNGPGHEEDITRLIMGDHAEAIAHLVQRNGPRAGFTDFGRDRPAISSAANGGGE